MSLLHLSFSRDFEMLMYQMDEEEEPLETEDEPEESEDPDGW